MLSLTDRVKFIRRAFGACRISRDGRNVDVRCPICAPGDRSKKKLSILNEIDDQRCLGCHCWTCGYRSRSLWHLLLKHGTSELLLEYRDRFLPASMRRRAHDLDVVEAPAKLKLPDDFRLLVMASTRDPDVAAIRRYLEQRHVDEHDQWLYKLGWSNAPKWRRRVIFPSFDVDGELNTYVGRSIDPRVRPRYEMPDGDRRHVIFNEINVDWSRRLILCEGPFDALKCGDNVVPMLGSDLSEASALFSSIIAHGTPVALAMDADMRTTKVPKIARRLVGYSIDVSIVTVPDDPGSMTKDEFKAALAAAAPFEWKQVFLDRLDLASRTHL